MGIHKNTLYRLRSAGVKIAKINANVETGNLQNNAITGRIKGGGIELVWNGTIAHYWFDLEEGTGKLEPYLIVTNTELQFAEYIVNELGSSSTKFKRRVNKQYEDTMRMRDAQLKERYPNASEMIRKRELQKMKSRMRVEGRTR